MASSSSSSTPITPWERYCLLQEQIQQHVYNNNNNNNSNNPMNTSTTTQSHFNNYNSNNSITTNIRMASSSSIPIPTPTLNHNTNTNTNSNTPWDRLVEKVGTEGKGGDNNDSQYLVWLEDADIDADEYNNTSAVDRRTLRSQFEKEHNNNSDKKKKTTNTNTTTTSTSTNTNTATRNEAGFQTRDRSRSTTPNKRNTTNTNTNNNTAINSGNGYSSNNGGNASTSTNPIDTSNSSSSSSGNNNNNINLLPEQSVTAAATATTATATATVTVTAPTATNAAASMKRGLAQLPRASPLTLSYVSGLAAIHVEMSSCIGCGKRLKSKAGLSSHQKYCDHYKQAARIAAGLGSSSPSSVSTAAATTTNTATATATATSPHKKRQKRTSTTTDIDDGIGVGQMMRWETIFNNINNQSTKMALVYKELDIVSNENCIRGKIKRNESKYKICSCLSILKNDTNSKTCVASYIVLKWCGMTKKEQKLYMISKIKESILYDENQQKERIEGAYVHGSKKLFPIPFHIQEGNNNSPMELITNEKLSKHYICKDSFYRLHHFGMGMRRTLEEHNRNNTIPVHGLTGQTSHVRHSIRNNKTLYPLLKAFFDDTILPLATLKMIVTQDDSTTKNDNDNDVGNNDDDNNNGNDNVILELPSHYSKRRLYRMFGWAQGWTVTLDEESSVTKVKRTDNEWSTKEPVTICGKTAFKGYWDQYHPTLIIRNDHVNAQAERAAIGFRAGPWSKEENDAFVEGYEKLGKKWKKIMQEYVPTRTNLSICTHGRRYLKKKRKQEEQNEK